MKKFCTVLIMLFSCTACGTIGGAISGAGTDMQKAGDWLKKK
jgi:predicted small secreted protein